MKNTNEVNNQKAVETMIAKLKESRNGQVLKRIESERYYSTEQFYNDCLEYVKAIKNGSMFCVIESVSKSGMSRNLKFHSVVKSKMKGTEQKFYFRNYWTFFKVLGHTEIKNSDCFRIGGCGMDMVFNTNYNNINFLQSIGIVNKKACDTLRQRTPQVF